MLHKLTNPQIICFSLPPSREVFDSVSDRMMRETLAALATCFGLTLAVDPLVDLGYSKYEGAALPNGISQWLGIRFAAPPVGDLRFNAPADPPSNDTVQVADTVRLSLPAFRTPR